MRQTWRWFGPADTISLPEIRQTGAQGIVSALHHVPPGEVWSHGEIAKRKNAIEGRADAPTGLTWDVVESVPVSETIKTQVGPVKEHMAAYRQTLINLAGQGIETVCYNFMPILDWTRTDLKAVMPDGATAMRFDLVDFCVFDVLLLGRPGAHEDYPHDIVEAAQDLNAGMSSTSKNALVNTVVAGLPGANDTWTLEDVRAQLATYQSINADQLRNHLIDFLAEVVPVAQEVGIRLCCHPDDPPFSLLGLPRVMSNQNDFNIILKAVDNPANGATLCTGSLGVDPAFDPVDFVRQHGSRIHFVHLRNTLRAGSWTETMHSFHESPHLEGDTDMVATIRALMHEQAQRKAENRADWQIPMRPDHGQAMLDDHNRNSMPGYPLIGRMRGLAELRGIMAACS